MERREFLAASVVLAAGAMFPGLGLGAQQQDLILPPPKSSGGKPLLEALRDRKSDRVFQPDPLPAQVLSDLLWAAWGINRPETGRHTAPSCKNWQDIDVYAATADGLFLYDPKRHALARILDKDVRPLTGKQAFAATAPLDLIYVVDYARMGSEYGPQEQMFVAGTDTGFISQNVYLFCASEGLSTVVRLNIDKDALAKEMGLRPKQWVTLAQTVGYPKR